MSQNQESDTDAEIKSFVGEAGKDGEIIPPKAAADADKPGDGGSDADSAGDAEDAKSVADADAAAGADKPGADDKAAKEPDKKDGEKAESEEDADASAEEKPAKKKQTAEQRIARERWRRGEVERELATLKGEFETLRSGTAPKKDLTDDKAASKSDAAPNPADPKYKYGEVDSAYIADTVLHHTKKALADAKATEDESRQREAAASKKQNDATAVGKMIEAGRGDYEDFDDVVLKSSVITKELPDAIHDLLMGADAKVGAQITYHLAANPEEARKFFGKSVLDQAAYFGRLEARYSAPAAKTPIKTPGAPPPPKDKAKGAGGKFATTPDTTNFEAFEKMVDQQQQKRN